MLNETIFREYDIRGIADVDLTNEVMNLLGKALSKYFLNKQVKKISIGYDTRLSSLRIRDGLKNAFLSSGVDVIDIGLSTTPLLYFSQFHLDLSGGIMITGSHNPSEYNGIKVCLNKTTIFGTEIQKIRELALGGDFPVGNGIASEANIREAYIKMVSENIKMKTGKKMKIVIDSGNGTGGILAPSIYRNLGVELLELNSVPDGRFPNHHPDPTVEKNMVQLKNLVLKEGADFGIGFDGDADRIGVVDEKGNIIWGDQLMIIFAKDILKEKPNSTFIAEVKCSDTLFSEVKKAGGNIIMWRVGHSLIKAKMKAEHAELAGEMSGHIFFSNRYYGFDDAIYAGARLIEIVAKNDGSLGDLLKDVPKAYISPEIRVDCPENIKFGLISEIVKEYKEKYEINDIDGARIKFKNGWALVRASNTQPVLVMRFEADTPENMAAIRESVEGFVKEKIRNS